jgi:hypothetical protein
MKFRPYMVVIAVLCALVAAPTFARAQSLQTEEDFQRYLANHPKLQADPALMSDPAYLAKHPNLALFLHDHPNIHAQARAMGAYDSGHVWRSSGWWYQHDPNWVHTNHPEWFNSHPQWYAAHPEWRTANAEPARPIVTAHPGVETEPQMYQSKHRDPGAYMAAHPPNSTAHVYDHNHNN